MEQWRFYNIRMISSLLGHFKDRIFASGGPYTILNATNVKRQYRRFLKIIRIDEITRRPICFSFMEVMHFYILGGTYQTYDRRPFRIVAITMAMKKN